MNFYKTLDVLDDLKVMKYEHKLLVEHLQKNKKYRR